MERSRLVALAGASIHLAEALRQGLLRMESPNHLSFRIVCKDLELGQLLSILGSCDRLDGSDMHLSGLSRPCRLPSFDPQVRLNSRELGKSLGPGQVPLFGLYLDLGLRELLLELSRDFRANILRRHATSTSETD